MSAEGTYEQHARSLQDRAKKAHADWIAAMPAEERAIVKSLRLEQHPEDNQEVGGHSPFSVNDIADTPLARTEIDIAAEIDKPEEILAEKFSIPVATARAILQWHRAETDDAIRSAEASHLQVIVGGLLSADNPKLSCAGLAFAANLAALNGLPSQREYAKNNHISPEAVSKMVRGWSKALNLSHSVHQKSPEACEIYSEIGHTRHWRGRKVNATSLLKKLKSTPSDPTLN